jgi:pyruvate,water dikinase
MPYIRDLGSLTLDDIALVGGKTAAIGELTSLGGVKTPPGFAITAAAYPGWIDRSRCLAALT